MQRRLNLMAAALFVAIILSWALAELGTARTWCVSPGPSGEVLYCTDDLEAMPAKVKDEAVERTGRLERYRKLTVQRQQPVPHDWNNAWCQRCVQRQLWRRHHRRPSCRR
jgi:hypothetical protein